MTLYEERLRNLDNRELEAYRLYNRVLSGAQGGLKTKLKNIKKERDALAGRQADPEVLVRTGPGPVVEIYHSSEAPCGRVHPDAVARGRYERLLLSEARRDRGLRPCSACASEPRRPVRRRRSVV